MAKHRTVYGTGGGTSLSVEESIKPPTKRDIQETKKLFIDFFIRVPCIPEFKTRNELAAWRTRAIVTALA